MAISEIDDLRFDFLRGRRLLVALSGGADSVALLHILLEHRAEDGPEIICAHFHHGIRGADADADAAFCQALCEKVGVELILGRGDVPAEALQRRVGLETAARDARYRFLHQAKESCGAELIALAHHADDQAETVLMHLLRGTGPEGIAAMPVLSGDKFRPLIGIRKHTLTAYLRERGIAWREDVSNTVSDNPRNALRLKVLPEMEQCYPAAIKAIARYARIAVVENDFLSRATDDFLSARLETGAFGKRLCLEGAWEEAILRRALRRICGARIECAKIDELIALAYKKRGKTQVFSDLTVEKTPFGLYFLPKCAKKTEIIYPELSMDARFGEYFRIRICESDGAIERDNPNVETLDAQTLAGACIRVRADGDRIHPLGAAGSRLLSDYLTDKKVDRPVRDVLPVMAKGKNILWVGGYGISEDARVKNGTTHCVRIELYTNTEQKAEEER